MMSDGQNGRKWAVGEFEIAVTRELNDPAWDDFVARVAGGHHEQLGAWGDFKKHYGWSAERLLVTTQGRISAGALILHRHKGKMGLVRYIQRGPLCDSKDPRLPLIVCQALNTLAAADRTSYLVIDPPYFDKSLPEALRRAGFRAKPYLMPPNFLINATLMLDLTLSLDELSARMHETTRYDVRRSLREGGIVRQGKAEDVPLFRELMLQLCARRGTPPAPPQPDYFHHLWTHFGDRGFVRIFLVEIQGRTVAAAFCFTLGDSFRVYKVGWSGEYSKARPNHLLWWEMIKWAKSNGFRHFDFFQIIPEHAQAVVQGRPLSGPYAGVTQFKLRFGGKLEFLPAPVYQSYRPLFRLGFGISEKLFSGARIGRVADRLLGGSVRAGSVE